MGRPGRAGLILSGLATLLLALPGCAVLTRPSLLRPSPATAAEPELFDDGFDDYVGVMHVHTSYSHDAHGEFEDVVRVANAQRLDFVMTNDHHTLQPLRDDWQGWHGTVLILIGMELSTDSGHYLAYSVTDEVERRGRTAQQVIDAVNAQGGFGFIAHPYFKKARWTNWTVTGFTGIEAYNVAHDTLDENKLRLVLWTLTAPAEPFYYSILDRPYDPLAKWDELIGEHGPVVGIGSTDAHEFHLAGLKFAPYTALFRLARTHLLVPQGEPLTDQAVYDALRQGHAYLSVEWAAEAKGFQFTAETVAGIRGIMGDTVPFSPDLSLHISLPAPAKMTLFKDGEPLTDATGRGWRLKVYEPGAYRVEATRHEKPWIISNPIYVLPADESAQPQGME